MKETTDEILRVAIELRDREIEILNSTIELLNRTLTNGSGLR